MPANFKFIECIVNPDIKPNEYGNIIVVKIQNQGTEAAKCFFGIRECIVTDRSIQPYEIIEAKINGALSDTRAITLMAGWFISEEEYYTTDRKQVEVIINQVPAIPEEKKETFKYIPLIILAGLAGLYLMKNYGKK